MSAASQSVAEEGTRTSTDQDDIDAFLREEGVPTSSNLTRSDIAAALVTLGYTVATASVKFVIKMALRRLDALTCVEGELRRDAIEVDAKSNVEAAERKSSTSVFGWSRHLCREDKSAATFLRGGWAELGFMLATSVEEAVIVMGMRTLYRRRLVQWSGGPRSGLGWACLHVVVPMLLAGMLSWPLRAVRTAVMVNYLADTTTLPSSTRSESKTDSSEKKAAGEETTKSKSGVHRYSSAVDVWHRICQRVGLRRLLWNGLDVDMEGRALSMTLVWTVVQPATRWIREVAAMRARAGAPVQSTLPHAASPQFSLATATSSPLLTRLGQHRYFNLAALVVVVGTVNTLQRPFVVLRQRMALLPSEEADEQKEVGDARRGCRYANGWDCARQVARREGATALFAGLPLCLLTSTLVPLVVTFAGYPTAPSFSGAVM
ncbi:hypothetical protein ABB37_07185 [Leptomonas pyrrhocoris]|uniref:Mitochondrial carrier protein n=1 Tax=Leptomonas pyrrhocoris TaxID=157538 RepID=A0A0M9FW53_LEPPY|nr:hypothetical protein ABB37_07185 [Leptomonas pyrrhocoris]KPA77295.1 hypothetical protein ABB37_07185 [Leptomonas pyrrhocoris]|eukprot:XP_015655734.1 hypothetical protein ABB37_07185 [Leptomonas pyrrhocoris]